MSQQPPVLVCAAIAHDRLGQLLAQYGLAAQRLDSDAPVPGSYWGAPEAGLVGSRIFYRDDTPVHSVLHEASHYVCMTANRRQCLDTDAGGDDAEECAVCYLEVLLADRLPPFTSARCLADMDAWGYSFREGSAAAWFSGDGREARAWLAAHDVIGADDAPTGRLRN